MPELAAAKALDLGVVPTGPCLGAEPPVLVSKLSVSLWLSKSIRSSGYRAHLVSHPASANICCKLGAPDGSEGPRPVHGGRSLTANMSSDSLACECVPVQSNWRNQYKLQSESGASYPWARSDYSDAVEESFIACPGDSYVRRAQVTVLIQHARLDHRIRSHGRRW